MTIDEVLALGEYRKSPIIEKVCTLEGSVIILDELLATHSEEASTEFLNSMVDTNLAMKIYKYILNSKEIIIPHLSSVSFYRKDMYENHLIKTADMYRVVTTVKEYDKISAAPFAK